MHRSRFRIQLAIFASAVIIFLVLFSSIHYKHKVNKLYANFLYSTEKVTQSEIANDKGYANTKLNKKPVILMWTQYFYVDGKKLFNFMLTGRQWNKECCEEVEITRNRKDLNRSTTIVFFNYDVNLKIKDLPKERRPDQLWVLFSKEPPTVTPNLTLFNRLFNWTMTYRQDSNFWAPYGETIKLEKSLIQNKIIINQSSIDKWIAKKTHLITTVMSRCNSSSKREDFVKLLRKSNITIDVYGNCGIHICSRHNTNCDHDAWWTALGAKYKFYFAAENSICIDYITEKMWRALQLGMVPVVYGGGNYTLEAPPGSFINVNDFSSTKDLADYLIRVSKNANEYRKYFEWRKKYTVRNADSWQAWCNLCKATHEYRKTLEISPFSLSSLSNVYFDLQRWSMYKPSTSNDELACVQPNFK